MNIKQAAETARKKLEEVLNKKAISTVSIFRDKTGWNADVEVLEEEYLPEMNLNSMNDIIGVYEVRLGNKGDMTGWVKKSSHKRGSPP